MTRPQAATRAANTAETVDTDRLLTLEEAAAELNVPIRFVRRLVSERRIAVIRLGRHLRIARSDIDRYVAASRTEPVKRQAPLRDVTKYESTGRRLGGHTDGR